MPKFPYQFSVFVDRETARKIGTETEPGSDVYAMGSERGYTELHMAEGNSGVLKTQTKQGMENMRTLLGALHRRDHPEHFD